MSKVEGKRQKIRREGSKVDGTVKSKFKGIMREVESQRF